MARAILHSCRTLLVLFVGGMLCSPAVADAAEPPVERADRRWAADGPGGPAEFSRHVIPLLGKAGCNNRACHGSFQGQNGFRLSLFGHDARLDYDGLTKKDQGGGPRVNLTDPDNSLALLKPIGAEPHDGGVRFDRDSWQYRLLHSWIATGATHEPKSDATLERVEIAPREIMLSHTGPSANRSTRLRLTACFSDGSVEDVTPLTLFSTNDETVAEVDEQGLVTAMGPGDTAIVATYGGAVVTAQIIVPAASGADADFEFPANNPIDTLAAAKWRKVGIRPSELAGDEVFLRRVYLDTIGTLPTADEARQFLAETRPDKRARLIDALLMRPEYGMYWATKFSDWTGNDNRFTPQPRDKTGWLWHDWLRDKLDRNVAYDEIVKGFITATTREGRSLEESAAEHIRIATNIKSGFDDGTYARRQTNDMFYRKATNGNSETVALQVAYAFMGLRLECAQCHKHPFDRWTQEDFQGFAAFFNCTERGAQNDLPKDLAKLIAKNDFKYQEVRLHDWKTLSKLYARQGPKFLGGPYVEVREGDDPRLALWQWMRSAETPYLAQAMANRLWAHYLGVGIVNPVDDLNAANPPSNPQLLDWLSDEFIASGYDLKQLHRLILNSRVYQLSWQPNETNRLDERNFSRALLRRMPAEVVMDAINQVTGGSDRYSSNNAPPGTRTINLALSRLRGRGPEYVLTIFGRPLRTQICDCERGVETGLAQAMYLLNDLDVNDKVNAADGRLAALLDSNADNSSLIEELYLATLSRYPQADELSRALAYVDAAASREVGMQDVLWSLLNLREFIFVH